MRESKHEDYIEALAKKAGGQAFKFTSPGTAGVPDRLIVLPRGRVGLYEAKKVGEVPEPLQHYWLQWFNQAGVLADWGATRNDAEIFMRRLIAR